MTAKKQGEPKGSPKKYDYTSTKRGQKRTALDNAWAQRVSSGKYKTLRNLMRAIHAGEYALVETQPTLVTAPCACLRNCESGKQFDNGNEHIPNQRHVIQAKRQTGTQAAGLESLEWTIDNRLAR